MTNLNRRDFLKQVGLIAGSIMTCQHVSAGIPSNNTSPNILLIVSEDNGPHLGCYGDKYVKTPVLDGLAQGGVRFENAFVPYSVCSPSRASYLTGLHPHQNGQIGLATHKYSMYRDFPNMVGLLKTAGYRTGIIGKLHVNPPSAFPFDFKWNNAKYISFNNRNIRKIADVAGKFISESKEPFFLSVNYPDAHFPLIKQQNGFPKKPLSSEDVKPFPWVGADSERLRQFTADYYNCLMRLDSGIGMLLDELKKSGKQNNTLIIYLGDHGPQFSRGKTSVYEAALKVPLIINSPGRTRLGIAPNQLVSTIDILPTVLDAVSIKAPDNLPGRSLSPLLKGNSVPWRQYIYAQTNGSAPVLYFQQHSIRDKRYKLIINPLRDRPNTCALAYLKHHNAFFNAGTTQQEINDSSILVQQAYATYLNPPLHELYDLENDPHEFVNLADNPQYKMIKQRLLAAFNDWQKKTNDPLAAPAKLKLLTEEHDRLKDHNYRSDPDFRWKYLDYFSKD